MDLSNSTDVKKWALKMVSQRKALIRKGICKRNEALMIKITSQLSQLLEANPYAGEKIYLFVRRHYIDFLLIVPGNKTERENLKFLNQVALCGQKIEEKKLSTTTDSQPLQSQLLFQ